MKNFEHFELDWLLKCNLGELIVSVRRMCNPPIGAAGMALSEVTARLR